MFIRASLPRPSTSWAETIASRARDSIAIRISVRLGSRPTHPAAALRRPVAPRHRPVGDEAAEVVQSRQVEELERPAEPVGPPAVPGRAMDGPVVEGIPPELTGRAECVGWDTGDGVAAEELRVRFVVGAPG